MRLNIDVNWYFTFSILLIAIYLKDRSPYIAEILFWTGVFFVIMLQASVLWLRQKRRKQNGIDRIKA